MASGKAERPSKPSLRNPNKHKNKAKSIPMKKTTKNKKKKQSNDDGDKEKKTSMNISRSKVGQQKSASASQQLGFFFDQFQSATGAKLSFLELESINDNCFLELSQDLDQDASTLGIHMKAAFGTSWKEELCAGQIVEGKIDAGSPAALIFSASALRSLELLRGLRPLTKECHAAKLFSKHMKVEEQESLLKNRVNIASGTPSRVKKLIDMEALGLSRLKLIVLDMQTDVKGYSLLTLRQVRDEFWDLYKSHFHQRLLLGDLRICLYGPLPTGIDTNKTKKEARD